MPKLSKFCLLPFQKTPISLSNCLYPGPLVHLFRAPETSCYKTYRQSQENKDLCSLGNKKQKRPKCCHKLSKKTLALHKKKNNTKIILLSADIDVELISLNINTPFLKWALVLPLGMSMRDALESPCKICRH